ncbi:DUF5693 family protein [Mesotoga prima]|uniref:DUF5693 family protein n=1 Tax=Mesotoga prima TaxID=1184387 RepID=UPI002C6EE627|nr:DUF5693 family protein [Mesotoga prima]HQN60533.1 DUF5693 family protein [Mesotoga prima]
MAEVPVRPKKPRRRRRNEKQKNVISLGNGIVIVVFVVGLLMSLLYIPWRVSLDSNYNRAALVTEKKVDGVPSKQLIYVDNLAEISELGSAVIFMDLRDDWNRLEEILDLQVPVILTGVSPYPVSELASILDSHCAYTGYMEFDERGQYVLDVLKARDNKSLVFRVHNLKKKEYPNYDIDRAVTRYIRSVRERSVDALLFLTPPVDFDYDELVHKSYEELNEQDLISDEITSPRTGSSRFKLLSALFIFVLILSVSPLGAAGITVVFLLFPTIGLPLAAIAGEFAIYRRLSSLDTGVFRGLLLFFSLSVFLGISINASMVGVEFQNGLELFRGVKVSLVALPGWLFVTGFMKSVSRKISKGDLLVFVFAGIAAGYYILRSGNFSFVLDSERMVRDYLDNLLLVRPRFKELLAYPLLAILIHFSFNIKGKLAPVIASGGSLVIVSIVNTFCHATVPLWTGLLRSLYGLLFGTVVSMILITFVKKYNTSSKDVEVLLNESDEDESN